MARIPQYQPDGKLDIPGAPQLPYRHLEIPTLGRGAAEGDAYAARALEGVGGAVQNLGADVTAIAAQRQAQADSAWLSKVRAETTLNWHTGEPALFAGSVAKPAMAVGGAGVVPPTTPPPLQDQTKAALTAMRDGVLKGAPNPRAAQAYQQWFEQFGAEAQGRAFDFDQKRQDLQKGSDLTDALNSHTQLVAADPSQFDAAWAQANADITAAGSWADPAALAKVRSDTRQAMEFARAKTIATSSPLNFLQEVTPSAGQYDAASGTTGPASRGFAGNPLYSHLDVTQIAALTKDAQSAVVGQHNQAIAAAKADYDSRYNDLMTSLLPGGSGGMADVMTARSQGWLRDYTDIKKAVDAIDTRDKQAMDLAKAQALFTTGHTFNPFAADDKKATDLVYTAAGGADGLISAPSQPGLSAPTPGADPQAAAALRLQAFVETTDIVPQTAVDEIRRGMISQDKTEMMNAYTILDGLSRGHPSAVANAFGPEDSKRLEQYQQLAPITPPDELVQAMNPNVDPATAKRRGELATTGKKLLDGELAKGIDYMPAIQSHFTDSVWSWKAASAPFSANNAQALRDDYETAFVRAYSFSGDETLAKAAALKALDSNWGKTDVGSGVHVMFRPPERQFPTIGQGHDWMESQIEAVVKNEYPDAKDWSPIALPETEGAIGTRQIPRYGIGLHDKDGVYQVLTPPPDAKPGWPFNYDAALADAVAEHQAARGSLLHPPGPAPGQNRFNKIMDAITSGVHVAPPGQTGNPLDFLEAPTAQ